jgi:ATP-dependent Clp protease ATP-binding subunit ClpA
MFERFTKGAREAVIGAQREARKLGHAHIGTEHLLLAVLNPHAGLAASAVRAADVTHEDAERVVAEQVGTGAEELGPADADALRRIGIDLDEVRRTVEAAFGPGALEARRRARKRHMPFTSNAKKVMEIALREALGLQHNYIGPEHILLGLIRCDGSTALRVLAALDITPETIRSRVMDELRRAS